VEEVLVDEGAAVEAGEVLLRLNADQRRIQKRRAEADLRLVQEQLREYRAGSRPEEIRQAEEAMYSAKALREEALRDLERIQSLYEKSAASQQEFTAARAAADAAEHTYQEKQAAFELARKGPRDEMIARAEALVASRQADLEAIVDDIQRAEIRAPYTGVLTEKLVDSGDYLAKGTPAFAMVQVHPIHVNLATPEDAVARIRKNMEIEIRIDAIPGRTFQGTVEAIVPLADRLARTFPVKVRVDNEEGRILPGMAARAGIPLPSPVASLAVPSDAIVRTEAGFVVYVVRGGRAALIPVVPGLSEDGLVEVRGELAEDEPVVIRGNERLRPGASVEIVPAGPPAAGPPAREAGSAGQDGGRA
jgi:multidrug efflux pump subunit AcrA (membrane-fusion protein)